MLIVNKLIGILGIIIILNITPVNSLVDSNPSNNLKNITINVVETKSMNITFRPVDQQIFSDSTMINMVDFINKTYPIGDSGLLVSKSATINSFSIEHGNFTIISLLIRLSKGAILSGDIKRVVGVLPRDWFRDFLGLPGTRGLAYDSLPGVLVEDFSDRYVTAHEIGHTFGFCEEYNSTAWNKQDGFFGGRCPNGDINDDNILDANCEPQGCPGSTIGKLAPWNNSNETVTLNNFMGNGDQSKAWVSNESYSHLLNKFKTNTTIAENAILVSGFINLSTNETKLDNLYTLAQRSLTKQDDIESGNFTIELRDSNNNIISNLSFKPMQLINFFNGSLIDTNSSYFIFVMNSTPNLSNITVKERNTIKAQRNKTPNTPTLNLTFPIGNELVSNKMNVTYNASDIDGNTINYAILISSDNGGLFSTLEIDHPNKTLSVSTSSFTEGQQYKVKVFATDGINTNTTISQNVFEIDNDLRITNLSILHENKTKRIFHYVTKNTLETPLSNISEKLDTGETTIQFTSNHALNSDEEIFVFVEYDYNKTGDKTITATASSLIKNIIRGL